MNALPPAVVEAVVPGHNLFRDGIGRWLCNRCGRTVQIWRGVVSGPATTNACDYDPISGMSRD